MLYFLLKPIIYVEENYFLTKDPSCLFLFPAQADHHAGEMCSGEEPLCLRETVNLYSVLLHSHPRVQWNSQN